MQEQMFKAICQYGREVHWFCKGCNADADKLLAAVSRIDNKVDKLESELVRMKSEQHSELAVAVREIRDDLAKMGQRIERCEKTVDDSKRELHTNMMSRLGEMENKVEDCNKRDLAPQWSDIVAKQVESKMSEVATEMTTVQTALEKTKSMIEEQRSREGRVNNVVIYNMPETPTIGLDRKDWIIQERSSSHKLFSEGLGIILQPEDVKRMLRLGKPVDGKSRPVLVEFRDKAIKNVIIESAPKLRVATDPYNKIVICHDMTVNERAECKKLVEEARNQESGDVSGEWIYRVRGLPGQMRIVKFRRAY